MSYTRQLDALVAGHKITEQGRNWLIAALDPFHDREHQLAGYPDSDNSSTVVSCYQYQTELQRPTGIAGETWDAHVYNSPQLVASSIDQYRQTVDNANLLYNKVGEGGITSFITCCGGPANSTLMPHWAPLMSAMPGLGVEDLSSGNSRVIAAGFEVINTTSELYKQGTITAYRQPTFSAPDHTRYHIPPEMAQNREQRGTMYGHAYNSPPTTANEAVLLRGTRTWNAADGAYVPIVFSTVHNPIIPESNHLSVMVLPNKDRLITAAHSDNTDADLFPMGMKTAPMNTSGVFLTGLHNNTTLTIKVRVYVERAPGTSQPDLAALASPSAPYDANVLDLYSSVLSQLPVAVDFASNGLGDWWRAAMSVISTVARPLSEVAGIFHPTAGRVISQIGNMAASQHSGSVVPIKSAARAAQPPPKSSREGGKRRRPKAVLNA